MQKLLLSSLVLVLCFKGGKGRQDVGTSTNSYFTEVLYQNSLLRVLSHAGSKKSLSLQSSSHPENAFDC